ncbi:MAG: two-component system, OmpR family, response regulator protein BraR/BceR [Clostridiales bacterium]|nr:two-component system, OmpR family, response regulator protein BraR/BceR [Clostridiales bacterium]
MHRVMLVEDDEVMRRTIAKYLESWDYEVLEADDFKQVMASFLSFRPQLVILDITLPFFNGYHWCSEIRRVSKVPILFLSSASDNMNIVMAMNLGGDDFIAKPFDLEVLLAKIQALLRRTYDFSMNESLISHRGAIFNVEEHTLSFGEDKIALTNNEDRILRLLLDNKGRVVDRETIMMRLWESDSFIDDNTLTVNVTRLRKKLEAIGLADFITTKKGRGYMVD